MSSTRALLVPVTLLLLANTGCSPGAVSLRPDGTPGPEDCSAKAMEVMGYLRMAVGDAADIELDANQVSMEPITLYDGPVESVLKSELGTLYAGTRLYGRVWTGGPQVVIRYYEARPPSSSTAPICAVARMGHGQMRKLPSSKPGLALLPYSEASIYVVDSFR